MSDKTLSEFVVEDDVPNEIYHKRDAWTAHEWIDYCRSPRGWQLRKAGVIPQREASASMALGTLVHLMALEPSRALSTIRMDSPINERTGRPYGADTKAAEAWRTEVIAAGQVPVNGTDYERADLMVAHVAEVCGLVGVPLGADGPIGNAKAELSISAKDDRLGTVQCRPDLLDVDEAVCYDLKTCRNIDGFKYDMRTYSYHMQAAWYVRILSAVLDRPVAFNWIAVESEPPYRCRVYSDPVRVEEELAALEQFIGCHLDHLQSGKYPLEIDCWNYRVDLS